MPGLMFVGSCGFVSRCNGTEERPAEHLTQPFIRCKKLVWEHFPRLNKFAPGQQMLHFYFFFFFLSKKMLKDSRHKQRIYSKMESGREGDMRCGSLEMNFKFGFLAIFFCNFFPTQNSACSC